ncbi:MAG: Methyltransferase type 11 [Planctomycetota bacterium]|nr:Methyltransferase type 11 [Planctomycetota bacterium]
MHELRDRLGVELRRQGFAWGHVASDRWEAVRKSAAGSVLDVGCSNGVYVDRLRSEGVRVAGLDLLDSPAWKAARGDFAVGDACHLPFADASFETVLSFETLEHVPRPEAALREYHRVCRRNVILSVPNCETPQEFRDGGLTFHHWIDRTHVNFFTLASLVETVERAGFRVSHSRPINRALPALPALRALGIPARAARPLAKVFGKISRRTYPMSLLVVGEKIPEPGAF